MVVIYFLEHVWWFVWGCPRTLEAAAIRFLSHHGPGIRSVLDPDTSHDISRYRKAWAGMICSAYGLGYVKKVIPMGERDIWRVSWNRRLMKSCGAPSDPITAAERILERVIELAQAQLSVPTSSATDE
jgi:hypothetical protein